MNDILQYKEYYETIHFSAADEVFFGKVLVISVSVSFEGSSVQQLKKAFHDAVEDYLETCKDVRKEPNKAYKGTFNIRISAELHKEAAIFSALNNASLNDFVKTSIHYALQHKNEVARILLQN